MPELGITEWTASTAQGMTKWTRRSEDEKAGWSSSLWGCVTVMLALTVGNTVLGTSGIVCCLILTTVCHAVLIPMMIPYFTD